MTGRTAAYGRAAFGWAIQRGLVSVNPFENLPVAKGVSKRERVLSDEEIGEVWHAAGNAPSPYGAIIRLLILTGQRRGEVAGMVWSEISDDFANWTLPGERTKNGVPHAVPLSTPTVELLKSRLPGDANEAKRALRQQRASGGLVFSGGMGTRFAGWSKAKRALDKAIAAARSEAAASAQTKPVALISWSVHDLRRTVATGVAAAWGSARSYGSDFEPHQRQPRRYCRGLSAPRLGSRANEFCQRGCRAGVEPYRRQCDGAIIRKDFAVR
jgi:integrase